MTESQCVSALLELLAARHGIGARAGRQAGWLAERVARALPSLEAELGASGDALLGLLERDARAMETVLEIVRVGQTQFFRDGAQWSVLRTAVVPALAAERPGRLRGLSAGCSTGEEAWSLAMVLHECERQTAIPFRVVGVDKSAPALAASKLGQYPLEASAALPEALRERYLNREESAVSVVPQLRASVSFVQRDLLTGPPPGTYELILCKNLIIYLGQAAGATLLNRLFSALTTGGILMVARSEVPRARALGLPAETIHGVTVFRH